MFNSGLKKEALKIHENTLERYKCAYETMMQSCEKLYATRNESVVLIRQIQRVVNSIANTPKEFDTKLGEMGVEIDKFNETGLYAKQAYDASLKAGVNIMGGAAMGFGIAAMTPSVLMSIATTFGTASTGTAISALSGAAAQKAAVAWIGRTFAGFAVSKGAGMAVGQAFLALSGPVGVGIAAASTGVSLISLSKKNKNVADDAVKEAKEMENARATLAVANEDIKTLLRKTLVLYQDMDKQRDEIKQYVNLDYTLLSDEKKCFLGTLVNNTWSLSVLLNKTVE